MNACVYSIHVNRVNDVARMVRLDQGLRQGNSPFSCELATAA